MRRTLRWLCYMILFGFTAIMLYGFYLKNGLIGLAVVFTIVAAVIGAGLL